MPSAPLVTVIIPLFNHEAFIGQAIESVLSQTLEDLELIIMDDGSTDGSLEIARRFTDSRVQVHSQPNQGCAATINHCMKIARGKFVAILNSDDEFLPSRLAESTALLESKPHFTAVFTDITCIDEEGKAFQEMSVSITAAKPLPIQGIEHECDRMVLRLLAGNFLHSASNLVCKRELFEKMEGFRDYRNVQDFEFFLRLAANFKIAVIPQALLRYRFHGNNTLGEHPSLSVAENAAVIATFLHQWQPQHGRLNGCELAAYLVAYLATYGGDRLICAYLSQLRLTGSLAASLAAPAGHTQDPMVQEIITFLDNRRDQSALENSLSWHTRRMNHWWEKAQHLKVDVIGLKQDLDWQAQQTDHWWEAAQQLEVDVIGLKQDLDWQAQQTDHWWEAAQQLDVDVIRLKQDLDWQAQQTDHWWKAAQQLDVDVAGLKQDLGWQSQQTHEWWSATQRLNKELKQANEALAYAKSNHGQLSIAAEKLRRFFGLAH